MPSTASIQQYLIRHPDKTANELSKVFAMKLGTLSSLLKKLVDQGYLQRTAGGGPRGGYVYRVPRLLPRRTAWQRLLEDDP